METRGATRSWRAAASRRSGLLVLATSLLGACTLLTNFDDLTSASDPRTNDSGSSDAPPRARDDGAPIAMDADATTGDDGDAGSDADGATTCDCPPGTVCSGTGGCEVVGEPACAMPITLGAGQTFHGTICPDAGRFRFSCDDAGLERPTVVFAVGMSDSGSLSVAVTGNAPLFAVAVDTVCSSEISGCAKLGAGASVSSRRLTQTTFAIGLAQPGCGSYLITVKP